MCLKRQQIDTPLIEKRKLLFYNFPYNHKALLEDCEADNLIVEKKYFYTRLFILYAIML